LANLVGQYAARFSVRALDVTVDASLLWLGASLALAAAIVLAYVPRLPGTQTPAGFGLTSGGTRITAQVNSRLRLFAITQIALSFVLLAGAGMLLTALVALQTTTTGYNMRVLAVDVPMPLETKGSEVADFFQEAARRVSELPDVERVTFGSFVPWRDAGSFGPGVQFAVEGHTPAAGEPHPHAHLRNIAPGFFAALGIPILAGRDFDDQDRRGSDLVVIVSHSLAARLFSGGDALNRHLWWTDPYFGTPQPRRIIGIVQDVDDENVVPGATLTVYHPFRQMPFGDRLFVQAAGDPYALIAPVTRVIRDMAADQPVERPATLADVRAEVLAPERLNAFVFSGFAGIALLIAVAGVAGVLAFSVSARTREFGVRLAVGSTPRHLLFNVLSQGAVMVAIGILAGAMGGYALARVAGSVLEQVHLPGAVPAVGAAAVLTGAALIAALMPAARASRVDVLQALRSE
jgi:predicted permease